MERAPHPSAGRRRRRRRDPDRRPLDDRPRRAIAGRWSSGRAMDAAERRTATLDAWTRKDAGRAKELHEARLGAARPLFDVHAYVDDFNRDVVDAYRRGAADAELPADAGRRPQHHPAGHRRGARLQHARAAHPRVHRARPASAAWPASTPAPTRPSSPSPSRDAGLEAAVAAFAAEQPDAGRSRPRPRGATSRTRPEVRRGPGAQGIEPAAFGIFVDPAALQGLRASASRSATPSATTRCT